jgi:hypothetical protein
MEESEFGLEPQERKSDIARRIFEFWKSTTNHPRSRLDDKRLKLICSRLTDGYTERDLKLGVFGCKHSRYHQGENDRHEVYDSIELIFRDADHVDKFMRLGEQEMQKRKREAELKKILEAADLKASTTGPTYQRERGKLLSIVKKSA